MFLIHFCRWKLPERQWLCWRSWGKKLQSTQGNFGGVDGKCFLDKTKPFFLEVWVVQGQYTRVPFVGVKPNKRFVSVCMWHLLISCSMANIPLKPILSTVCLLKNGIWGRCVEEMWPFLKQSQLLLYVFNFGINVDCRCDSVQFLQ